YCFFFSSRRRHTRSKRDWSSDVCSSDLVLVGTTKELYVKTHHALVSSNSVGNDRRVRATQMGRCVHIVEGCGDVESIRHRRLVRSEERRVGKEWRTRWWT